MKSCAGCAYWKTDHCGIWSTACLSDPDRPYYKESSAPAVSPRGWGRSMKAVDIRKKDITLEWGAPTDKEMKEAQEMLEAKATGQRMRISRKWGTLLLIGGAVGLTVLIMKARKTSVQLQ